MTNVAIQKQLVTLTADVKELKRSFKINSAVLNARARLRAQIIKGLESGHGKPINVAYWKELRTYARHNVRKA